MKKWETTIASRVPLSDQEKAFFTLPGRHLDYRYTMLMRYHRNQCTRMGDKICAFEAAQISCRMFMEFLGLAAASDSNGLRMIEKRKYFSLDGTTDEVKVTDLGGTFVNLTDLTVDEQAVLATLYHTVNKGTAHLTYNAPDMGHPDETGRSTKSRKTL